MLRVGIIGSGFGAIGLKPAFESVRGCTVVGFCHGKADARSFLERCNMDAVAIAVPPRAQYEIAKAAIAQGLHVFAEKPFTANLAQAKELCALARKKGIVHGIDFEFTEINEWKRVRALLDRKTYGRLNHVSVSWDWMSGQLAHRKLDWKTKTAEGGGVLSYYFSHGLNYLEHFAGEIADVKSVFTHSPLSRGGGEVGIDMLLKFKSGATGTVHVSCNAPGFVRHQLVFACERGVIVLESKNSIVNDFTVTVFTSAGKKVVRVKKDTGRAGEDERVKIVRKLAKRFVDACIHKKQTRPSFADGLRVQKLIEKIRTEKRRFR